MDEEDLVPLRQPKPKRDLAPLGIAELDAYVGELEAEIQRAKGEIALKQKHRGGAESVFKR